MSIGLLCPGQGAQKVGMGVLWAANGPRRPARSSTAPPRRSAYDLFALCAEGPAEKSHAHRCLPARDPRHQRPPAWRRRRSGGPRRSQPARRRARPEPGRVHRALRGRRAGARGRVASRASARHRHAGGERRAALRHDQHSRRDARGGRRAICAAATADGGVCVVANLNAPGQVVISVATSRRSTAPRRSRPRRASVAPSGWRLPARSTRRSWSRRAPGSRRRSARARSIPRSSPCTATSTRRPTPDPDALRGKLIRQLTSPVLFADSIRRAMDDGVTSFVELSPGRVLTGLVKKVERKFPLTAAEGDWDQ